MTELLSPGSDTIPSETCAAVTPLTTVSCASDSNGPFRAR